MYGERKKEKYTHIFAHIIPFLPYKVLKNCYFRQDIIEGWDCLDTLILERRKYKLCCPESTCRARLGHPAKAKRHLLFNNHDICTEFWPYTEILDVEMAF